MMKRYVHDSVCEYACVCVCVCVCVYVYMCVYVYVYVCEWCSAVLHANGQPVRWDMRQQRHS